MSTFERLVLRALALLIRMEWAWVQETDYAKNLVSELDSACKEDK